MTTNPTAEAARRNLADKIQIVLAKGGNHYDVADAILAAYPQIAPPQDVVEGARVALGLDKPPRKYRGLGNETHAREANMQIGAARAALEGRVQHVAAFATAHAAREREAIEQIIERRMKDMDESMAHYGKPGGSYEMVERADHAKHAYADILTAIRARKP